MTLPKFAVDYKKCHTNQLCQFVRQRTGNLRRQTNRPNCLKKLKQLDREITFRFLDLPPELRNRVYEELLHHNDELTKCGGRFYRDVPRSSTAFPALLRTCQKIHNEARGILYAQSSILMRKCEIDSFVRYDNTTRRIYFQMCLLSIRHITLAADTRREDCKYPRMAFTAIATAATDTPELQVLNLVDTGRRRAVARDAHLTFHYAPLSSLPASIKVKLYRYVPRTERVVLKAIGRAKNDAKEDLDETTSSANEPEA